MTPYRTRWILVAVAIVVIILAVHFLLQTGIVKPSCIGAKSMVTEYGTITICTTLPPTPKNVTLYRVVPRENDTTFFSVNHLVDYRPNVTSEADAVSASQKALLPYGGLPADAQLSSVETQYIETYDTETHQVTDREPISTTVQFYRNISGIPVGGGGGFIRIELGNYGELIYLYKIWHSTELTGTAQIIPASAAIEKMSRGEVIGHRPKCNCELNVDKIQIAYYEKENMEPQEYLEPVWVFAGTLSGGDRWKYYVPAREGSTLATQQ